MITLTKEQRSIADYDLSPGQILKVVAFAGTGKTSTLVAYANARPNLRFLYIAFNKSVQLEAARKFPSNVVAKTSHALAFGSHGHKYKKKLVASLRANTVLQVLDLQRPEDAKFTIETLKNYLASMDAKVSKSHIPCHAKAFYNQNGCRMPDFISLANRLGKRMCDVSDDQIGMLHDCYLKLYQLSNPVLKYDCILLDEAQDINPVTSSIVLSQANSKNGRRSASVILVGDSHQQIYSFRGGQDTLQNIAATKTMYLTQSFRFDNNIARVANMVLQTFKKEPKPIMGMPLSDKKPEWDKKDHTIIARTNASLFDKAVQLVGKQSIGFVGGVNGCRFNMLKDAYYLFAGRPEMIFDPYLKGFGCYADMRVYADAVEDFELLAVCKVVENYRERIPGLVKKITEMAVDAKDAQVVLTTAHKSKGLEWSNVLMLGDFQDLIDDNDLADPDKVDPDEFNLIYVAMTRAVSNLRFDKESTLPQFIKYKLMKAHT